MVLVLWILITCQVILEETIGGNYAPYVTCLWVNYYSYHVLLFTLIQFILYSLIIFVVYISIFVKIKVQRSRQETLGKYLQ